MSSNLFDAYYFAHNCGRPYRRDETWLRFFGQIADHIVRDIQPHTVLDAGCAMGFLVEALRRRGVEAWGVDISEYAVQQAHPDVRPYLWVGSVLEPLPRRFDLIVCIEVLEHLPGTQAAEAVANLCRHTDDILFSSTPFDYKEATHFNVQPPEVWAEWFARNGFFRDVDFDASFITPWAIRFRRRSAPLPALVRAYERRFWSLWQENHALRTQAVADHQKKAEQARAMEDLQATVQALEQEKQRLSKENAMLSRLRSIVRSYRKQGKPSSPPLPPPGNVVDGTAILCNFCGTVFPRTGPNHSEFLACPTCGAIARERVVYHVVLHTLAQQAGQSCFPLWRTARALLSERHLLECSPRFHATRRAIYEDTLAAYLATDYDMKAHRADIQMDLTREADILPHKEKFDIVLCAHVLEHIPDYRKALQNLHTLLRPGGFLVLQVPVLEAAYTPVTWDEFHGDQTRVFHRFGFDLYDSLREIFSRVNIYVGQRHFPITSPEIAADKYAYLDTIPEAVREIGADSSTLFGLGIPDLCDAFLAFK